MTWMTFKNKGCLFHINMAQIETVKVKTEDGKAIKVSFYYVSDGGRGASLNFRVEEGDDADVVARAVDEYLARIKAGVDVRA